MRQVGKFNCGCDGRKEIMSQGNWKASAVTVGAIAVLCLVAWRVAR